MKIDPAFTPAAPASSLRTAAPRAGAQVFRVPDEDRAASARAPSGVLSGVSPMASCTLVAAIAAQDERRQHRRRRQRHASGLLDRLEALARDLVIGRTESAVLVDLETALAPRGEPCDDPVLEDLVQAVELRAAVEMAKLQARKSRV